LIGQQTSTAKLSVHSTPQRAESESERRHRDETTDSLHTRSTGRCRALHGSGCSAAESACASAERRLDKTACSRRKKSLKRAAPIPHPQPTTPFTCGMRPRLGVHPAPCHGCRALVGPIACVQHGLYSHVELSHLPRQFAISHGPRGLLPHTLHHPPSLRNQAPPHPLRDDETRRRHLAALATDDLAVDGTRRASWESAR
jgi:hypothetical protein